MRCDTVRRCVIAGWLLLVWGSGTAGTWEDCADRSHYISAKEIANKGKDCAGCDGCKVTKSKETCENAGAETSSCGDYTLNRYEGHVLEESEGPS